MAADARLGWLILGLLACNTTYYLFAGRLSEALESLAWYALLILFKLESARSHSHRKAQALQLMRGVRLLASCAIVVTAVLYLLEQEWLDAINLSLWVAVVAMLEIEVRHPAAVAARHRAFARTAALLYSGLGVLVLVWLTRKEWMDAWDAAMWLTAFGLLELKLLQQDKKISIKSDTY
jgi:hypothetical protein